MLLIVESRRPCRSHSSTTGIFLYRVPPAAVEHAFEASRCSWEYIQKLFVARWRRIRRGDGGKGEPEASRWEDSRRSELECILQL